MSSAWGQFRDDCGASGPLKLEWDDGRSGAPERRAFDRPAVLAGADPKADLVLDAPGVSRRHAYLQVVEGRLFAVDLESQHGLRWGGVPRPAGWVDPNRPVEVGGVTLRVVGGDQAPAPGPNPLSARFASRMPLPGTLLEFGGANGRSRRYAIGRVLSLVGRSERCQIRLRGPETPTFVCSLLLTRSGLWVVDLLSVSGVTVNGVACREALLEDGDTVRVGGGSFRVLYDGTVSRQPAAPTVADRPGPVSGAVRGAVATPATLTASELSVSGGLPPEAILRPFLEGVDPTPEALSSSPFGQALLMLIRLLGDMHSDHIALVREELEQIRRLHAETASARASLAGATPSGPADPGLPGLGPPRGRQHDEPANGHLSPQDIQVVVGQRLADWELERQSRWRKVIDLLARH